MEYPTDDFGRWVLPTATGIDSLEYVQTPLTFSLGPHDVLVRMQAVSLNPRDLAIINGIGKGLAPTPVKAGLIPGSDGAGIVLQVGSNVQSFRAGDRVVTHIAAHIGDADFATTDDMTAGLGQQRDGTLRQKGVFPETALVHMPKNLSFEEAATLTCSGLTAWNALFGNPSNQVQPGDYVLVQGTGGVSIAALQLATAAGAVVIATTSNEQKADRLAAIGASHVINYHRTKNWGEAARELTPNGRGVDHVIDIGGYSTLAQSISATRPNGIVSIVGASGGFGAERPDIMEVLFQGISVRGVVTGNRLMLQNLVRFIEEKDMHPVLDDKKFQLKDLKAAMLRLARSEHFSKVILAIE